MGAQLRVYRQKIQVLPRRPRRSLGARWSSSPPRGFRRRRQRMAASGPYARAVTRAVSAVATYSNVDHVLTTERENPDARGCSSCSPLTVVLLARLARTSIREANELAARGFEDEGREVVNYLIGRKAVGVLRLPSSACGSSRAWTGNTDAARIRDGEGNRRHPRVEAFVQPTVPRVGVDEIHIVYNRFVSMLVTQTFPRLCVCFRSRSSTASTSRKSSDVPAALRIRARGRQGSSIHCCRSTSRAASSTPCCSRLLLKHAATPEGHEVGQ